MDVGRISQELGEEDLRIIGEDGEWESSHVNQEMYREFKAQAPEYVEAKCRSIKQNDPTKIDFEHWMVRIYRRHIL
eukprot:scaffold442364_cov30-Prasinocladus_malaysianus.AAC.1